MDRLKALLDKKDTLVAEAREITTLAEEDDRDFTRAEIKLHSDIIRKIERANAEFKAEHELQAAERALPISEFPEGNSAYGASFEGPAIVEQFDTTTVIHPGQRAEVDEFGNLLIVIGE